ncbi:MAG TPA: BatA domain-containing protein [Arenibacter sp.]|nr:BatA domain-containing protein [Arenibacter sp.]
MLFKHPELLWSLFLLCIPILIHLFQLRRFKKTPFTNVKILKKVVTESRKGNVLKKWLLLGARLLLLSALIIAFAQPFIPGRSALKSKQTIIYLDNSFSMQALAGSGTLLENGVQELLRSVPEESDFSLFTNDVTLRNVRINDVKNDLLSLPYSNRQLTLDAIRLKAKSLFDESENTENNLIVISDFQERMLASSLDSLPPFNIHLVPSIPDERANLSLDSVYVASVSPENLNLVCILSSSKKWDDTPVSLYNGDRLIAKTAASFNGNLKAEVSFTLPAQEVIKGKIALSDSGLSYDNELYFNIDSKEKIKVLAINEADSDFLKRIFREEEFLFSDFPLTSLNYGSLDSQNLIILNELTTIPTALQHALVSFMEAGGSLVIIPPPLTDMENYNLLLARIGNTSFASLRTEERKVTKIHFAHPLYQHVFEEEVDNFQYPTIKKFHKLRSSLPPALSYADGEPFLIGGEGLYIFSASLAKEHSNFTQSPLIVPTFYNIGRNSLKLPRFYEIINSKSTIDLSLVLDKNQILKISNTESEFIPLQRAHANKTTLTLNDLPTRAGIYNIMEKENHIGHISFNQPRAESRLTYLNPNDLIPTSINSTIGSIWDEIEKDNTINELWKWFVILAFVFTIIEVLIQKYLK